LPTTEPSPLLPWRETFLRLRRQIQRALDIGDNTYSFGDLLLAIERGRFKLFWAADPPTILVVEILNFPRYRVANYFITAGHLPTLFKIDDRVRVWAKEQGCKAVVLTGRKGWSKAIAHRGWKVSNKISMYLEI